MRCFLFLSFRNMHISYNFNQEKTSIRVPESLIKSSTVLKSLWKDNNNCELVLGDHTQFNDLRVLIMMTRNERQLPLLDMGSLLRTAAQYDISSKVIRTLIDFDIECSEIPNHHNEIFELFQSKYFTIGIELLEGIGIDMSIPRSSQEFERDLQAACLRKLYGV